jgi:hypothetical protein
MGETLALGPGELGVPVLSVLLLSPIAYFLGEKMPFKKTGKDKWKSPSGKKMSGAQVRAYYAKVNGSKKKK